MKLRVLLILPLDGGSLIVGMHVAEALGAMKGIEMDVVATQSLENLYEKSFQHIQDDVKRRKTVIDHINLVAMGRVVDFKPDLVLVMALAPITPWFIDNVKQLGVMTSHWYVENLRYFPSNPIVPSWQIVASHYDFFFHIQTGDVPAELDELGVKESHYLPSGCNPRIHRKLDKKGTVPSRYDSGVCFVGFHYPNRVALFKSLREFNIALWGPGWGRIPELRYAAMGDDAWVDSQRETEIINGAKIGLNVHSTLESDTVIQRGDFLNPRVFTIAACGTFQLVDEQEPLGDVFEIGREVATYHDLESLKEQLTCFLKNTKDRESMASLALDRVLAEHTYEKRIEEMVAVMGLN